MVCFIIFAVCRETSCFTLCNKVTTSYTNYDDVFYCVTDRERLCVLKVCIGRGVGLNVLHRKVDRINSTNYINDHTRP